jgi:hypothetical protein
MRREGIKRTGGSEQTRLNSVVVLWAAKLQRETAGVV